MPLSPVKPITPSFKNDEARTTNDEENSNAQMTKKACAPDLFVIRILSFLRH
jgi:hypothetical protein